MIVANVNLWGVLVSAVVGLIIGGIWHGPLFGKAYMHAMGMETLTEEQIEAMKKSMKTSMLLQFVANLVMFFIFAWILEAMSRVSLMGGLYGAFLVWLGFIVPVKYSELLWGGKPALFWIGIGDLLLTLLAAGAIIGSWR